MREQEPGINDIEDRANVLICGSDVEPTEFHVPNSLFVCFAASDVELLLVNICANSTAAGTYSPGKFQSHVPPPQPTSRHRCPSLMLMRSNSDVVLAYMTRARILRRSL